METVLPKGREVHERYELPERAGFWETRSREADLRPLAAGGCLPGRGEETWKEAREEGGVIEAVMPRGVGQARPAR